MLNGQLNFDMSQDVVMLKLKEQLRDRMTNKMKEHAMKSKRIRNELDICQQQQQQRKNIVPLNEINFLKRDKNPLLPRNDFNPYAKHNYKSQQFERRLKYENNYN
jgi:predicted type IV restriction endonuclease